MGVPIDVKVERTDLKEENERLRRRYGECQNELTQTMCDYGGALDDIDKLKSENDKLRERTEWLEDELRKQMSATSTFMAMARTYQDDNKKLRELVCEVWRSCPVNEDDCKKCPHYIEESDEVWCDVPIRMHELGIEVSDE